MLTALYLTLFAASQEAAGQAPIDPFAPYGEARVREVFAERSAKDQKGLIGYLNLDLSHQETFTLTCLRHALSLSDQDPGFFSDAPEVPHFDPSTLAPGQPIPRKPLALRSSAYRSFAAKLEGPRPPRRYRAAWVYDWELREPVRLEDPDDPVRHFENALAGFPPQLDLAEALVLQTLDDGSEAEALAAFAHSYTDRSGGVYPGITLYDAWSSGVEMEMPDVDVLGLATALLPKLHSRWVAPIPNSQHKSLYGQLFDRFTPAKQHRGLRESLARTFLQSRPVLHDGFTAAHYGPLHGFWELHSSTPAFVKDELPSSKKWEKFLADLVKDTNRNQERQQGAVNRRVALEQSEAFIQGRVVALMKDLKWFEDDL